eukprot:GHVR01023344.1.p2 GENE.GHVR01023344.1~~GHVR01023344.1.p2  ORF type:complete len:103 (+),score=5.80 GHVR01023344.1:276-584(+)
MHQMFLKYIDDTDHMDDMSHMQPGHIATKVIFKGTELLIHMHHIILITVTGTTIMGMFVIHLIMATCASAATPPTLTNFVGCAFALCIQIQCTHSFSKEYTI